MVFFKPFLYALMTTTALTACTGNTSGTVTFVEETGNGTTAPVKGVVAWVYAANDLTIKTVYSDENGKIDLGNAPIISWGYARPVSASEGRKLHIYTFLDVENPGGKTMPTAPLPIPADPYLVFSDILAENTCLWRKRTLSQTEVGQTFSNPPLITAFSANRQLSSRDEIVDFNWTTSADEIALELTFPAVSASVEATWVLSIPKAQTSLQLPPLPDEIRFTFDELNINPDSIVLKTTHNGTLASSCQRWLVPRLTL